MCRGYCSVMVILLNLLLLIDFVYLLPPSASSIFPAPLTLSLMLEIIIWLRCARSTDPLSIERSDHMLGLVLAGDQFRHFYCFDNWVLRAVFAKRITFRHATFWFVLRDLGTRYYFLFLLRNICSTFRRRLGPAKHFGRIGAIEVFQCLKDSSHEFPIHLLPVSLYAYDLRPVHHFLFKNVACSVHDPVVRHSNTEVLAIQVADKLIFNSSFNLLACQINIIINLLLVLLLLYCIIVIACILGLVTIIQWWQRVVLLSVTILSSFIKLSTLSILTFLFNRVKILPLNTAFFFGIIRP